MKTILITGGTGFQGSNLAKNLLESGYNVVILNTPGKKNKCILFIVITQTQV